MYNMGAFHLVLIAFCGRGRRWARPIASKIKIARPSNKNVRCISRITILKLREKSTGLDLITVARALVL